MMASFRAPDPREKRSTQGRKGLCAFLSSGLLFGCMGTPTSPSPPPMPPRADLVLLSGQVVRLDPGQASVASASAASATASAVAVKDGRIVDVGSDEAVRAWIGAETQVVDVGGRAILPGLVDSHVHLVGLGLRRFGVDLVGTRSIDEITARIRDVLVSKASSDERASGDERGDGIDGTSGTSGTSGHGFDETTWLRGFGWDQNDWGRGRNSRKPFPTARDLDAISKNIPIVLTRIDGHALWANSKAMRLAGIGRRTKAPPGGEIVRRHGQPTGIFIDSAMALIQGQIPTPSDRDLKDALLLAQKECLTAGLTGVHDMNTDEATLRVLKSMDAEGELRLRVYAYLKGNDPGIGPVLTQGRPVATMATVATTSETPRLAVRGVKYLLDGALGSRGAALLSPYADERSNRGLLLLTPEQLEAGLQRADAAGFQVAVHAIGDRANRIALDAIERVFGVRGPEARPRIEHAQVVDPSDVPRFAAGGVIASMQPAHATSDMGWAEKRLGPKRIRSAYAWHTLLTANATIAAGSDAPVEDVSPVLGLFSAITRKDLLGTVDEGWYPDERMTPSEAVRAYTTGAAYASFSESDTGQIRKGYRADFTVLDVNPIDATEDELAGAQVQLTIVGGQVEFAREGMLRTPTDDALPASTPSGTTTSTTAAHLGPTSPTTTEGPA
ncbi:MAG: amidohydrolase [Deltaproteobacteria bacterium]|nr:amidohydrolase [Deltaproteobacteria bacterium]